MNLIGSVEDGKGHCQQWSPQLIGHYRRLSGIEIVPGTLNVKLERDYVLPPASLRLRSAEWNGPHDVLLFPCRIFDRDAVIIRTEPNNLGQGEVLPNILEIASATHFRSECNVQTNDRVVVEVDS
jgi:CTP-dependent riboflavin kinase